QEVGGQEGDEEVGGQEGGEEGAGQEGGVEEGEHLLGVHAGPGSLGPAPSVLAARTTAGAVIPAAGPGLSRSGRGNDRRRGHSRGQNGWPGAPPALGPVHLACSAAWHGSSCSRAARAAASRPSPSAWLGAWGRSTPTSPAARPSGPRCAA